MRKLAVLPILSLVFFIVPTAGQPPKDDAIGAQLRKDKEAYVAALQKARADLLKEFDRQYELVKADKNLKIDAQVAALQALEAEKKAFDTAGTLPTSLVMKVGVSEYFAAGKKAVEQCKAGYETAAKAYKDAGNIQAAAATLEEMKQFTAGTAPAASAAPTVFVIVNKASGRALTPRDRDDAEGTKVVQLDTRKGDRFQMWRAVPSETGYYYLENVKSGLVMAVHRDSRNSGAEIVCMPKRAGSDYQLWKPVPIPDDKGYYKFENRASGKVFGVDNRSTAENARLILWTYNGGDSERFAVYPQQ